MGFLQRCYFSLSPFVICTVLGQSMEPTIHQGAKVLVAKKWFLPVDEGSIIILQDPSKKRILLKRVKINKDKKIFVEGDNKHESTDSRDFGWIEKRYIIGKVIKIIS